MENSLSIANQPPSYSGRSTYRRILAWLTDGLCGFAVFGVVLVVLAQVISRLLGYPVKFSEELTRALFIWMVFTGIAAGMRHADAARVTIFMEKAPVYLHRLALPIYFLFGLGFFVLMGWMGWRMVNQQLMMNEMIATLGWPSWIIGMVMPLSAVLSLLCMIDSLYEHKNTIAIASQKNAMAAGEVE